jgi:hypothetical protein
MEREIVEAVFTLYGLTPEEIKTAEGPCHDAAREECFTGGAPFLSGLVYVLSLRDEPLGVRPMGADSDAR